MRHHLISAWAVGLVGISIASAQTVSRKEPAHYAVTERASRVEAPPPGMRLGLRKPREYALAPLSASEIAKLSEPGPRLRTGVHRSLPADLVASTGSWETTSDGTRVWRIALRSPGSAGMRIEFRNFSAGSGSVWIHDGVYSVGPFTGRGLFDDGHFWSPSVPSDSITLEYQPGPEAAQDGDPPFEIRTVVHQAINPRTRGPLRGAASPLSAPDAGTPDPADYCHLDPNCYPEWKGTMSMVGQITFEVDGGEAMCSGALIGTRDNSFKPYFLTAGHCIHSEDAARSMETFWTYQTSACAGTPPASRSSSTKSTVGAHLLDSGTLEQGDYSLVLLKDVPSGVTFAGWDVTDPTMLTPLTGIHHPVGSWKRISFGERVGDESVIVEDDFAPGSKYLSVLWLKGRTEPGSSGSPLFSSPGVIVGTLTYGPFSPTASACEINPSVDGYGRFSNAYPFLKSWLEDYPASQVSSDKTGVTFAVANHATPATQTVRLTTQSTGKVTYKLRADASWLNVSTVTGDISASTPATVTIAVNPALFDQPGRYTSTVTIISGTADPQFINVTANVTVDQSNVAPSITPGTVPRTAGAWSFTVKLAETAGAATQVTALRVNGKDYSSSIASWFGTARIPAKGSITAPLTVNGGFPAGTQFFEFSGVDDAGQHWYRQATVIFQ